MKVNQVLPNPNFTSTANYIIRYTCFKIWATLGPPLWYFWARKRGHQYAHITVALINHTACRFQNNLDLPSVVRSWSSQRQININNILLYCRKALQISDENSDNLACKSALVTISVRRLCTCRSKMDPIEAVSD